MLVSAHKSITGAPGGEQVVLVWVSGETEILR